LWDYLYHDCDHAGVWIVNFDIAQMYLGKDMIVDEETALKLFNKNKQRIFPVKNGDKWFILPFFENQYGGLNPENRVHASVIKTLNQENIESFKGLVSTSQGAKDKYKDKEKDKEEEKNKGNIQLKEIFDYWNEQKIITHRCFTVQMKGKINAQLKLYTAEEIRDAIKTYADIIKGPEFYFNYKWTLVDFFSRGFDKFTDVDSARANYRISKTGVKGKQPVNPSFKKAKVEMKPEE